MKKLYFLIFASFYFSAQSQVINFPDPNFKAKVLLANENNNIGDFTLIDANLNGEIEQSEAAMVMGLNLVNANISDLTGIEYFVNIRILDCTGNQLSAVDLSHNRRLWNVIFDNNQFSDFEYDTSVLINPTLGFKLSLHNNPLTRLRYFNPNNIPQCTLVLKEPVADMGLAGSFSELIYHGMQASEIEIPWAAATFVEIFEAPNLQNVNIKNGHPTVLYVNEASTQLQYVCMDENDDLEDLMSSSVFDNIEANSYCTFVPGGDYFDIAGHSRLDLDGNGCGASDIGYPNLRLQINDGSNTYNRVSNASGYYQVPVSAGTYTVTPQLENPAYFNISPSQISVSFPAAATPSIQDFCITTNGQHADLEVVLMPFDAARPGFEAHYKLIYKNKGNVALTGSVVFSHANNTTFVSSAPVSDVQTAQIQGWYFSDLMPFEQREILIVMRVNSPMDEPAVSGGDVLSFGATGNIALLDENLSDNIANLSQTVVNSFDPNDKTCLEGSIIAPEQVGKYVHYLIRFENTGTANAQNIVVRDDIDAAKFDVSSLIPMDGSHDFVTRINGNKVEFIFEDIQLPFDDANNDGYVMFKIKTKPTLAVGDSFSNAASIYFDYNHPIVTDPAVTTISVLKNKNFEFSNAFTIYPNPANDVLNVQSKQNQKVSSVEIYNALGHWCWR